MATNNTSSANPRAEKMGDVLDALSSGIAKTAANEPKFEPKLLVPDEVGFRKGLFVCLRQRIDVSSLHMRVDLASNHRQFQPSQNSYPSPPSSCRISASSSAPLAICSPSLAVSCCIFSAKTSSSSSASSAPT